MTRISGQAKDLLAEAVGRALDEGQPSSLVQFLGAMNLDGLDLTRDQRPVRDLEF